MKFNLSLKPKGQQKMHMGIKMSNLLSMSDKEFRGLLKEIENDPIFCLLKEQKVIKMKGFLKAGIAMSLKEEILADTKERSIEPLLEERRDVVELIKGLGAERFKEYFWQNEEMLNLMEIRERTGLALSEIKAINSFLDDYEIVNLTNHPKEEYIAYTKIASISDDLTIGFFLRDMTRGVYHIDREKLSILKDRVGKEVSKKLTEIIRRLEEVNARKTTIYQIIEGIIKLQRRYIETGKVEKMVVLTETDLAERIGVNPSSVSRAIYRRTVETKWGERSLKFFFPSKKAKIQLLLKEMGASSLSDEKLKAKLVADYGISTSRRQITSCRNELRIPSFRSMRKRGIISLFIL